LKFVYLIGTAGSGKSTLALSLTERLQSSGMSVSTLNLDPGVRWLPYSPDVDVRDYVNYDRLVEEYKLGPNGGLVASADAAVNHVAEMKEELQKLDPDYVFVDTPGQMELFAFRDSGMFIASALSEGEFSTIFLADSIFLNRPSDFVSILLLSYSINARFMAPQINCISKVDLLDREEYEKASMWADEPLSLRGSFLNEKSRLGTEFSERMLDVLLELGALGDFIFTSSNTGEGLDDLYAQLQRIHTGSEDDR
jgi:hypothetical protein